MITPRQRDADHLVQQLWRARVWMNQTRRARKLNKPNRDVPLLLREILKP